MLGGSPLFASLGRRLSSAPVGSSSTRDLLDQIREDWLYNGEEWTRPGFRALAMYRFGVWRMTVKSRLLRAPLSVLYRFLHRLVRNHYGIELHYTAKVGERVVIAHQGGIVIHEFAEIGNECVICHGVTIGTAGQFLNNDAPKLGRGVTLGAGAVVMGNVKIGDGAKIGPNAVVMIDVPAGALAVAPPARVIQPGAFNETNRAERPTNNPEELSFGQKVEARYAAAQANGPSAQRNNAFGQPSEMAVAPASGSDAQPCDSKTLSFGQKVEARYAARSS